MNMKKWMVVLTLMFASLAPQHAQAQSNVGFTVGLFGYGVEYEMPVADGLAFAVHGHVAPSENAMYSAGLSLKYFLLQDVVMPYVNVGQVVVHQPAFSTVTATELMAGLRFRVTPALALDVTAGLAYPTVLWENPSSSCKKAPATCGHGGLPISARYGLRWYF